ncbi:hypothetical protein BDQ17DRAFT_1312024 [Cyathus striatus]|nr:hypothetical protein BDQ17DRAFT_1312024 [Cyathus striatus]
MEYIYKCWVVEATCLVLFSRIQMSHSSANSPSPPQPQPLSLFEQTEREQDEVFYRTFPAARQATYPQPPQHWLPVDHHPQHYFPGTAFSYGPPPPSSPSYYSKLEPLPNQSSTLHYLPIASSSLQHAVTDPATAPHPHSSLSLSHSHSHSHNPAPLPAQSSHPAPAYSPQADAVSYQHYDHFQHHPHIPSQCLPVQSPLPPLPSDPRGSGYVHYSSSQPAAPFLPTDSAPSTSFIQHQDALYPESPPSHSDLAYSQSFEHSSSPSPFSGSGSDDLIKSESPEPFRHTPSVPRTSVTAPIRQLVSRGTWPPRSPSPAPVRISPMAGARRGMDKKPPLACLFCRGRKIACGPPLPGSKDKTCNQCQRRSLKCEYPLESRRGMRKKKDTADNITAEGPKVVIKSKH